MPRLQFQEVTGEPLDLLGERITPIRIVHGQDPAFGYRVGDLAYCTDVSGSRLKARPYCKASIR